MTQTNSAQITMYSTTWCPDCHRAKAVMQKVNVPFTEINITHDEEAVALVEWLNNGRRSVPTIVFPDGSTLTEPSNAALMAKLSEAGLLG